MSSLPENSILVISWAYYSEKRVNVKDFVMCFFFFYNYSFIDHIQGKIKFKNRTSLRLHRISVPQRGGDNRQTYNISTMPDKMNRVGTPDEIQNRATTTFALWFFQS